MLVGERTQRLEGGGAAGERPSPLLVVQGDDHRRVDHARERLDGVHLERRELVEAVEEDRRGTPGAGREAQGVERARGMQLRVGTASGVQVAAVRRVERAHLVAVRAPARVGSGPGAQRADEARRLHPVGLELGDQPRQCGGKAGCRGRLGKGVEGGRRDRGGDDALARELAQRRRGAAGGRGDGAHEPGEAHDPRTEHEVGLGQLAPVVIGIRAGGDDEQRVVGRSGAQRVQDDLRLGGVRGACDESERHVTPWSRTAPTS